jgi:hypothetical protein
MPSIGDCQGPAVAKMKGWITDLPKLVCDKIKDRVVAKQLA